MLTTRTRLMCATCHLAQDDLPEWAQGIGAIIEQAPGVYQCASGTIVLPSLPKLSPQESERLEHELQLFAWLSDRAIPEQRIGPLKIAADVVAAVEQINEWAEATGTVIYNLRHWPLGRALIIAYGLSKGTRCY